MHLITLLLQKVRQQGKKYHGGEPLKQSKHIKDIIQNAEESNVEWHRREEPIP